MPELLKIFLSAMLIDNVVLVQYLALCPFIGMTSDTKKAFGMGVATTFVIILATVVTYPIYYVILVKFIVDFVVTLICISKTLNYLESIVYALGSAGGFVLSMVVMSGIRVRLETSKVPSFLKGNAILFITAGLLSMAFMGFAGLIK